MMYHTGNRSVWYELGYDVSTGVFTIQISRIAWQFMNLLTPDAPVIRSLRIVFSLPNFIFSDNQSWGFGGVFSKKEEGEWIVLSCSFSKINLYQVCISLKVLFIVLSLFKETEEKKKDQLITIEEMCTTRGGFGGFALSAHIFPALFEWIEKQGGNSEDLRVIQSMRGVYKTLGLPADRFERFELDINPGPLIDLMCPGNACWLNAYPRDPCSIKRGYMLNPHNVDHPVQQLAFLAGLATMYQSAREDGF
jgi:hypothetical protein